jgi:mRNA interferase MazF
VVSQPRRAEVWLIALDPSRGSEIKKTRPCLVISPDEANESLRTDLIAPMTTTIRSYPTRIDLFRSRKKRDRSRWISCEQWIVSD